MFFCRTERHNTPETWYTFKQIRNQCIALIRSSKLPYKNKITQMLHSNNILTPKIWWKQIKSFAGLSSKSSNIPPLCYNNCLIDNNDTEIEILNDDFVLQTQLENINLPAPDLPDSNYTSLSNIRLTTDDVKDTLTTLDINKAVGPDLIHSKILKEAAIVICEPLSKMFNLSLKRKNFPSVWKRAKFSPVFKKEAPSHVGNYRPISLLSIISKVMERCIFKYLHNHLLNNKIITPHHSGFTHGDCAINQLVKINN